MAADLRSLSLEEITAVTAPLALERYRAKQIYEWINRGVSSFDEMQNLPKTVREKLSESFRLSNAVAERVLVSKLDGTTKILCRFDDGESAECVALAYKHGISACLSTQAGCKMGCSFCASTKAGFSRNLLPGEMLMQLELLSREKKKQDPNAVINHIVLMGIGEPLDNYDNTIKFLRLVNDERGLNIGMRNISLSTCGLVDKILRLAEEDLQLTLSVSLHAPTNEIRSRLMPVNNKFCVEELIDACKKYINKTGRRISFEYALISGVNDSITCADKLASLLSGMLCHVNLIPVNQVRESGFSAGNKQSISMFTARLSRANINVTVRRTMGADINAACGQLRAEAIKQN